MVPGFVSSKGQQQFPSCSQTFRQVDGKVRSDMFYPAGFMDVVSIAPCRRSQSEQNWKNVHD
jgi:hypothetical protein